MVMKQQRKGQQKHDGLMETKQQRKRQPNDRVMGRERNKNIYNNKKQNDAKTKLYGKHVEDPTNR